MPSNIFIDYHTDRIPLMQMSPSAWYDCDAIRRACDDMHVMSGGRYQLWEGRLRGKVRPRSASGDSAETAPGKKKAKVEIDIAPVTEETNSDLAVSPGKAEEEFRNYQDSLRQFIVANHYCLMRRFQTVQFVEKMEKKWIGGFGTREKMTVAEAFERLNNYVDSSDPDSEFPNVEHALQTAEGIRAAMPDWFQLVGLIHDMGKIQFLWGSEEDGQCGTATGPQWALGGDTWLVGCKIPDSVVFPEFNKLNPDMYNPAYNTEHGIYTPGQGIMSAHFAFGHDEYMYQMLVHNKCKIP